MEKPEQVTIDKIDIIPMNILSGKLTGHRPAMIVGNLILRNSGEKALKITNC